MHFGAGEKTEICNLYYEYDVKFIKLGGFRLAGHVMCMEESDPAKKVLCSKPTGSGDRQRGRPKFRWCDELEKDVARVGCGN